MSERTKFQRDGRAWVWQGRHPVTAQRLYVRAGSRAELEQRVEFVERIKRQLRYGTITRQEAARALAGPGRALRVRELYERWIRGVPETSRATYASAYRHRVERQLGEREVWELTEDVMREWTADALRSGYAPKSVRLAADVLRGMYRIAVQRGELPGFPWGVWRPPKNQTLRPMQAATELPDLVALLQQAAELDQRDRAEGRYAHRWPALAVLCLCGLRQAEASALGWDALEVDEAPYRLRVSYQARRHWWQRDPERPRDLPKGGKRREQLLHADVARLLRAHRAELEAWGAYRPEGPVFPGRVRKGGADWSRAGRLMKPEAIRELARSAGLQGWQDWTTHATRHTFTTLEVLGSGGDLRATMDRTGHSSVSVLQTYLHPRAKGAARPAAPALPPSVLPAIEAEGRALPARSRSAELPSTASMPALPPAPETRFELAREWLFESDRPPRERKPPPSVELEAERAYARGYARAKRKGLPVPECRRRARASQRASLMAWWAVVRRAQRAG